MTAPLASALRQPWLIAFASSLAALALACGGSTGSEPPAPDGGASDASGFASDVGPDSGRYTQGVYLCCGPGEGRSCCPPNTLPDPNVGRTATCFQYGGVTGRCTAEGQSLEAKDICSVCCSGLTRVESSAPGGDGGACVPTDFPSVFRCTACGDGTCGLGENRCNCPADCK